MIQNPRPYPMSQTTNRSARPSSPHCLIIYITSMVGGRYFADFLKKYITIRQGGTFLGAFLWENMYFYRCSGQ
jgi:hypothetical protein